MLQLRVVQTQNLVVAEARISYDRRKENVRRERKKE